MMRQLVSFELNYYFRHPLVWLGAFIFFALGATATMGGFGGDEVYKNSPYVLTTVTAFVSMFSIFVSTVLCGSVVLRDTSYKMDSVIFSTGITRGEYFFSRFTGLILVVFFILCFTTLGLAAGGVLFEKDNLGPFNPVNFIQPLLVFGLPNILFSSGLIFCTAILTRNTRAIYASGVLLYILYITGSILGNSPMLARSELQTDGNQLLPLLMDPFGLAGFFGDTRNWTDAERNARLFSLEGAFLVNRLMWTAFTALIVLLSYSFFRFRLGKEQKTKNRELRERNIPLVPFRNIDVQPHGFAYNWLNLRSQFKIESVSLFKHIPFMVMMLLWVFLYGVTLNESLFSGMYGIHFYPATGIIVEYMRSVNLALILIIFYAAELLSRERSSNIHQLVYTTPVRAWSMWAAKILTLAMLVFIVVSLNICIGIVFQIASGYTDIELPVYLTLYYYCAIPLVLYAILVLFIQNLASNKYVGMLLSMLVIFAVVSARRIGIEHVLLRYAVSPQMVYSYFNGFGHYSKAFNWLMLYWAGLAGILSVLTIGMWRTAMNASFGQRVRNLYTLLKKGWIPMGISLLVMLGAGVYCYRQLSIGEYKNNTASLDWSVRYEKKYRSMAKLPQPVIKAVRTEVELFPAEARYTVKGSYRIRNETNEPIKRVWVNFLPSVTRFSVAMQNVRKEEADAEFKQHFFELKQALLPGQETNLSFNLEINRNSFVEFDPENSVVENGTYIEMEKFVPHFGYRSVNETDNDMERKKAGLAKRVADSSDDDRYYLIDMETTISTPADQYVVSVGELQKDWTANGRRYFHYKTAQPVNFMFALSSARYAIRKERYKGIDLSICYLPGQEINLAAMFMAMKDALDYGNKHFSPYPLKRFMVAEIPQYKGAATAYPGVVFSSERINFLDDFSSTERLNHAYTILTHEVAHQWWANTVAPVYAPGAQMLTESLAKYTELILTRNRYGKMKLRQFLHDENTIYWLMHIPDGKEPPLAKTTGQQHVYYQKGGLVMYGLQEMLGEARMNQALQGLISAHAYPGKKARPADLLNLVGQNASPEQARFIEDNFNKVVTYALSVEVVSCKALAGGRYKVDLDIRAQANEQGQNKPMAPGIEAELALFAEPVSDWNDRTRPLYLKKLKLDKQQIRVSIETDRKPRVAAIDPYAYLLDADPANNLFEIE